MLGIKTRIPKAMKPGTLQPVLPLVPIKLPSQADDKPAYIQFELKTRVGQATTGSKYKKHVRKFEDGSPQEWIDLMRDFEEIWTQNGMTSGQDQAATVTALLGGETETTFDVAFQEARTNAAGNLLPATEDHVKEALSAVTKTVFPHRALEIQRLWMNRRMFKPADLNTRQTAAAITRLNNALPMFPDGTEASKFSEIEIIGLLEWSLPPAWRAKFDLDGYVPTLHPKMRLIESCEAIERNEVATKGNEKTDENHNNKNNKKSKSAKSQGKAKSSGRRNSAGDKTNYYCTEHGNNPSHDTSDCFTIKNRAKNANGGESNKKSTFSNKQFRKEINMLAKKSSKAKVLDLYATAVSREKAKLAKKSARKRKHDSGSDSDSETGNESHTITKTKTKVSSLKKKPAETNDEEVAYQKRFRWLEDHGEDLKDEKFEGATTDASSASE